MWLLGSAPPRPPAEPCVEKIDHGEKLHNAIKQASATNVKMLENTTRRSLDQIEETISIIERIKRVVASIPVDAANTAEGAAKLMSREDNENDR